MKSQDRQVAVSRGMAGVASIALIELQAAQRPAKNVRRALLPTQAFKVVGAKVKLHD